MLAKIEPPDPSSELLTLTNGKRFKTIMADPPWRLQNSTGKVAPGHKRLNRYGTMTLAEITALPVAGIADDTSHLYLWVPNALLPDGLAVLHAWGFTYKSNVVWHKVRKDGGSDGRGVGFYFRNVTELLLFGVRGKNARTLAPGRSQVNMIQTRKREHSASQTSSMSSSSPARPARIWNYSGAASVVAGLYGVTKPMTAIGRPGRPTGIIPKQVEN
ncbi:MAG: MT-A70 family methyltransferase [Methylovirgula sp.]